MQVLPESEQDPEEPQDEPEEEAMPLVTSRDLQKHIEGIKLYLMQRSDDRSETFKILAGLEAALAVERTTQSAITSYFNS